METFWITGIVIIAITQAIAFLLVVAFARAMSGSQMTHLHA